MDIYNYLKKDHKKVNKLMEDLLAIEDKEQKHILFEKIKQELLLHAKTEEKTFYQEIEDKKPAKEWVEEAKSEHKEIEKYLKKLSALKFGDEEWIEQFGEFKHSVSHHVEEEEGRIFDKAKQILSSKRADELSEEMEEMKKTIKI
jgi:hemerythrin superfamily protein